MNTVPGTLIHKTKLFFYKKKIVLQKLVFYSRVGREKQQVVVGLSLAPVRISVWAVSIVSISVRPVSVSVVSVPRISLRAGIGRGISSGLSISSPLSIVVTIVTISVPIVSISVWPVSVSVVSVPSIRISLSIWVRSRLSLLRCTKCHCHEGGHKEEGLHVCPIAYSSAP